MATQLVKLDDRSKNIQQLFTVNMPALVKSAPRTVGDPNRLIRVAFNSIAYNPDLLLCTHSSLLAGVMEAVKLGLTIGGPMQESFLLPFKNHGTLEANLVVGYQGYRNLVDRSKAVMDLHPRAVYANDSFDVELGSHPRVSHKPYWVVGANEPGPLVAVYAVAHLRGGGTQMEVMPKAEVDAHRAMSRAGNTGPWVNHYDAMALKTVIRKIVKYLPKQSEVMEALSRAMQLDDRADRGEPQYVDTDLSGMQVFDQLPAETAKPSALAALKAKAGVAPVTKNDVTVTPETAQREIKDGLALTISDAGKQAGQAATAAIRGAVPASEAGEFFVEGMSKQESLDLDRQIADEDAKRK